MKKPKKRKNKLAQLKKRLDILKSSYATTESEITKSKLMLQIIHTEEQIKIESIHRISGFNHMHHEIIAGAPGLGKKS